MDCLHAPAGVIVLRTDSLLAWVLPYGARLMQLFWLHAPEGPRPLSLGFTDPLAYAQDRAYLGAVCGRYANRIGDAVLERGGRRSKRSSRVFARHSRRRCATRRSSRSTRW